MPARYLTANMKFFKIVFGLILCAFTTALTAQTNTTTSGTWNDASVWSTGVVPGGGTVTVNVNHPLEINTNIAIGTSGTGVYNIFQSMTDFPGGTSYTLQVGGNGTLDVQGGTTFFGGALASVTSNGASIRVRSGATLILTGPTAFSNGTTVLIDAGGTLIINGDFENNISGTGSFTVQGTVQINGNYSSNGDVDVVGGGEFFTTGSISTTGASGTVFGSGNNCTTGPCSGQNLCLGGNSNVLASNQFLCTGGTASGLTGDAIASATYQWQSSTTSSTTGFADIPSVTTQNYNPGTPAQTTWYRRRVTVGACSGASSAVVITIVPGSGWIGNNSADWNDASNWCSGVVPTNATDVVIPSGVLNSPVVSTGTIALCRNLTISSGATLTVQSTRQLNVSGNLVNNGTLTVTGIITFDGSTAQTISGSGFGTFASVVVNNSSGATPALTIPSTGLNITTALTMTAGKINLSNANLTLGTAAASAGTLTYTNGWAYNGNLTRWIPTGAFAINSLNTSPNRFPIGSSSDYRPIYIGNTTGITTGGTIRARHTAVNGSSAAAFSDNGTPIQVRTNSFWTVATGGGLATANNFEVRTDATGMGTVGDINHLRLTLAASAAAGTPGTNAGITTNPQVNRTGIPLANLANNFYWGSIDATNTPLPIELISFTATLKFDIVELKWSTASELNNDHFTIERTIDLEHFEEITTISGNGTTKATHHYNTTDNSPAYGRSYYRLKQTDYDGKYTYSDLRVIDYEGPKFATLRVYPNPLSDTKNLNVVVTGLKEQSDVPIMIYNVQGQLVYEQTLHTDIPGTLNLEIEFTDRLRSGLYIIKAGSTLQLMQKLVVE